MSTPEPGKFRQMDQVEEEEKFEEDLPVAFNRPVETTEAYLDVKTINKSTVVPVVKEESSLIGSVLSGIPGLGDYVEEPKSGS